MELVMFHGKKAFTLVELLVVIGIIAVLISIFLPALTKARAAAESATCKALLRQYAQATEMYANDNNGYMVDSFRFLDYFAGLPRYFGGKFMSEKTARCPADKSTEEMGRLGLMGNGIDPADSSVPWTILDADGNPYVVLCGIGGNQNALSASRRKTSKGYSAIWVKKNKLLVGDSTRTMIWSDWQNNPDSANYLVNPVSAIVSPGASASKDIGTLCFRHNKKANAAFLDGHVGELAPTVGVIADGHALAAPWPAWTGFAEASYPWAPRNNGGTYGVGVTVNGVTVLDFPGIIIR
jgi:prepilin-type processing-associated H-X9-DG protein/prepilin-type N-terminal cleavage/methylation domain-containing protein